MVLFAQSQTLCGKIYWILYYGSCF